MKPAMQLDNGISLAQRRSHLISANLFVDMELAEVSQPRVILIHLVIDIIGAVFKQPHGEVS